MGMGFLLVAVSALLQQPEVMLMRKFGRKHKKGGLFFNAVLTTIAMIYFFLTDKEGLQFPKWIVIYGSINALMYAIGFFSAFMAYKEGPYGITRLFGSFSAIIATFVGIFCLNESASAYTYIALVLIVVSLCIMNCGKKEEKGQKISLRWIIYLLLVVASNAAILVLGRLQHEIYGDAFKNEFLMISLFGATIALIISGIITERDSFKEVKKHALLYGIGAGLCNGVNNIIILTAYNFAPISFTAPVKIGLDMILTFSVAFLIYKEKLAKHQVVAVIVGVAAVILMNF